MKSQACIQRMYLGFMASSSDAQLAPTIVNVREDFYICRGEHCARALTKRARRAECDKVPLGCEPAI